jgi:hypothetical protein
VNIALAETKLGQQWLIKLPGEEEEGDVASRPLSLALSAFSTLLPRVKFSILQNGSEVMTVDGAADNDHNNESMEKEEEGGPKTLLATCSKVTTDL